MSRSKRDILDTEAMLHRLGECLAQHAVGEPSMQCRADAAALRRISMTLTRWHELECGTDRGHVKRDEKTGKPQLVIQRGGASGTWRFDHFGNALSRYAKKLKAAGMDY